MDELIAVNVLIADRTYRVKVQPKDEEVVRKTIKFINDKIIQFKTEFAGKDMQDYLGMVVLWYATQQQSDNPSSAAGEELQASLERMELLLDKSL